MQLWAPCRFPVRPDSPTQPLSFPWTWARVRPGLGLGRLALGPLHKRTPVGPKKNVMIPPRIGLAMGPPRTEPANQCACALGNVEVQDACAHECVHIEADG